MNTLTSTVKPPQGVALVPRVVENIDHAAVHARRQAALLAFGRKSLLNLSPAELVHEVVAVLAKTLDSSVCGLVELKPGLTPPTIEYVTCVPPEAALTGPQAGSAEFADSLVNAVLGKPLRLVITDLPADARFRNTWFEGLGVRSAIAVPLDLHDHPLGALFIGSRAPGQFDDDDLGFVELVGNLLTAHTARARAEEAAQAERDHFDAILDNSPALTLLLDARGEVIKANRSCLDCSGLKRQQIIGKPFWSSMCDNHEARIVEATFSQLSQDVSVVEFESSLCDGEGRRSRISWRLCYLPDANERSTAVIATGLDISRQHQFERRVQQEINTAELMCVADDPLESQDSLPTSPKISDKTFVFQSPRSDDNDELPKGAARNRRTSERKLFPYRQLIAPYIPGTPPRRDEYQPVRCWDISAGGLSFLSESRPHFKNVVVVLGSGDKEMLMTAKIVRVGEISDNGDKAFLIGCCFTGRL